MTSIKEIMKKDFSKLSSSDNVESAVELMEKRGVDYLLIEEKGEIKGVVTSHELVGYPSSRPVLDCKIKPIATIAEKTRLNEALKVLEEKEVNFLVIVNKKGSPIGVINKEIIIYFLYQEVKKSNKAKKKQITERKRAEEALRESEERYRLLAESAQDPIFIIDSDIRIQYTNQFAARLLGYRPEELIGKYIEEVFHPDLSNSLKYGVQTVFESGEPLHAEGLFTLPDKELWLDTQLIPLKTESGEIKFILGISRDITERKWAEETLKESEERYRTIFETTGTAMLIGEEDTTISMINAEFEKLCGYSKEKVEGKKSWIEFIVKADQERMKEYHRLRMIDPNAAPPHYEFQFIDKRGNVKDAFITLDLIPGTKKTVVSLINITERKRAEEALRESEMRFRTIVETAPSLLIITDAVGNNLYVSHNCEEITGYTQEELLGELIWWVHEDDTSRAKEIFERTFRDGVGGKDFEYKAVKKNGDLWYASSSWEPLKDEEEKFKGIVFQTIDITERKRAEEALRASETEKKSILNAISDIVVFQDRSLSIRWVNEAAARFVGKTSQELIGCHCYELWYGRSEPCEGCPVLRALETGSSAGGIMTSPDGRWWEITGEPVRDMDGKIVGAIEIARDITEHKRAEEQIKASLKEKEVLLREIHHRVKNNLQVVSSLLSIQARAAKDKDAIDILSESRNRINAMALIHTQLYENSNLSEINMKGFVDKLLRQLLMSYSVHDTKITPIIHVVDYPFPISMAVPVGLIVNELLSNALKHAFVNRKEGKIEVGLSASGKDKITLTVSDDGVGLPEGFDITATRTLGLRMVKILVEDQLQGNLEVISKEGTSFKIEFDIENSGRG